tara:strand:- start:766 stop:1479 length:714 start_codon:yes stop_codon:yes gene_type:complete
MSTKKMFKIVPSIIYFNLDKNQMVPLRPEAQKRVRYASSKVPFTPPDSRLGQILKPREFNTKERPLPKIISNTYEADLRRGDMLLGLDPLFTENTLKNIKIIPLVDPPKREKVQSENILIKAVPRFKIKNGHIEVSITCPIENLYTNYYSKGVKPPLNERILAYEKIGYTNLQLAKMIKNDDNYKKNYAENVKFIESIFGDASKKKAAAAPKKKTLLQMIGYKKPKYATNEDAETEA